MIKNVPARAIHLPGLLVSCIFNIPFIKNRIGGVGQYLVNAPAGHHIAAQEQGRIISVFFFQ